MAFALATGFPSAGAAPPGMGKRLEATSARPHTTAPTPAHLVQKTAVGQRHGPRPPRTQTPRSGAAQTAGLTTTLPHRTADIAPGGWDAAAGHAERSDRKNWSAIWLSPATKGLLLGAHTLASLVIASARSAGCPRSWPIRSQPRRDPRCRFGTEVADDSRHQASPTARMAFEKPVGDYASISICKL